MSLRTFNLTLFVAGFCTLSSAGCNSPTSGNPVSEIATGMLVKQSLDDFGVRLASIASRAAQHGDFLVEKNARKLGMLLTDAHFLLDKQLDKRSDQLSVEHQRLLNMLREGIDELDYLGEAALALEDFVFLDLQDYVNQLPFKEDVYLLRRIDGYSQTFRKSGLYQFRIVGSAFGPGYHSNIIVNGHKVGPLTKKTSKAHTLEFSVPAKSLNDSFKDDIVARVDLSVECMKGNSDEVVFTYADKVLLLPNFPVTYELSQNKPKQSWSEETFWSEEAKALVARTDRPAENGEDPSNTNTVSVTIPEGYRMEPSTATARFEPQIAYGRWTTDNFIFSNEGRTVSRTFKHWLPNYDREIFVKVKYRKPVTNVVKESVYVAEDAYKERLPFGTYFAQLANDYQSYTCMR